MTTLAAGLWRCRGAFLIGMVLGLLAIPNDCVAQKAGADASAIKPGDDAWPPLPDFSRHIRYPIVQVLRGDLLVLRQQKRFVTVRLAGVLATSQASRTLLRDLIEGREVFIQYPRDPTEDEAGRPMLYVYRCEDRLLVNLELISSGHGLMATPAGHLRPFLEAHERIAEREQRGLWGQGSLRTYKDPVSKEYQDAIATTIRRENERYEAAQAARTLREGRIAPSSSKAYNNEVRIVNRLDHEVKVELVRTEQMPQFRRTFSVAAGATRSVRVPDGDFKIRFEMSDEPGVRYEGDPFALAQNGVEIKLEVKAGGNYGLRKVE